MAVAANITDDPRKYGLDTDEIQWMNGNGNPNWSPTPERVAQLNSLGYYKAETPTLKSAEGIATFYANAGTPAPTAEPTPVSTPAPTSGYQSAPTSTPYNVATLAPAAPPPDMVATPQEEQQSDLITKLQALNDQYATKSAYQTEQESLYGVDAKQATKNSLLATQRQLINEGIQAQLAVQQGQGVTTAIDNRQRDEKMRVNAINALSISSLIAAADGDLANAQLLADRAVAEKFDPIEAEINAKMNNLNLIRNDPKTTLQEQNRAQKQQAVLDQQAAAIAQQKSDMKDILSISADAAANGATAVQLQKIQAAKTPGEALQIMASFGLNTSTTEDKVLSVSEAKALGVPYGTKESEAYGTPTVPTTSNPYSSKTFIQSGTGQQVTGEQIMKGSYPSGTFFIDSKTGEQLSASQIKSATTTTGGTASKPITSGGLTISEQELNEVYTILQTGQSADGSQYGNPMGSDGFVDPAVYLKLLDQWKGNGGLLDDFLKKFPPNSFINPKNTWIGAELKNRGVNWKPAGQTSSTSSGFTEVEKRKLEQAGLTNATRQQQLDHLYGSKDGFDFDSL